MKPRAVPAAPPSGAAAVRPAAAPADAPHAAPADAPHGAPADAPNGAPADPPHGALADLPDGAPADPPGVTRGDSPDQALVAAARAVLLRHYRPHMHTVAAAIRANDGRIWTGLHLGATVGRLSVCAEAVALGRALLEGDGTVDAIVAVRHPKPEEPDRTLSVVPPCGACRELLLDHAPAARVLLMQNGALRPVPVRDLLPAPYQR